MGKGLSYSVGIEQSRRNATTYVLDATSTAYSMVTGPARNDLGGSLSAGTASRPDFVANLRVDQAWGGAQIMAAAHDVSAQYFGNAAGVPVTVNAGNPSNTWGWAAGAGLRLNAPMIGPGDYFQAQVGYAEGATKYTTNSSCGGSQLCNYWNGNNFGFGFASCSWRHQSDDLVERVRVLRALLDAVSAHVVVRFVSRHLARCGW